jgi:hypothetical protein
LNREVRSTEHYCLLKVDSVVPHPLPSENDGAFREGRVDACRRSSVYIDGIETVDLVLVVVKWVLMCNGFGVPESVV